MTFSQWFKKSYPGREHELSFKEDMRRAWNAAAEECARVIRETPFK